jgi:two-component sensor histidine kinase
VLQHTVDVTELHSLRSLRDGASLVERANAVQARNRDLAEESEQLRNLLEKAPGFVGVLSGPTHIFIMANEAYRRLVGERDLVGYSVAEALPEVVEQGFIDLLDQVHSSRNAHVALRQKVALRNAPSGESQDRFLDFIYQPIFTDSGEVSGVLVQGHDVSDQVEAEEHQKRLINELNHRVKNTLAIVQSLAMQSFRKSPTPADGLTAFTARLAALSAAHNLLTRANWEAASLDDVLRAGIEATAGFHRGRFRMSGPAVTLQPQVATSVAMLVHELSTNALRYGALASSDGWVDIRWSIAANGMGRELAFDWSEQGGPRIEAPVRRGFGTRLIERGFASDKASSVSMTFPPSGLQCRIVAHIAGEAA